MRVVTFGSDHPFTPSALALVRELKDIEHVEHVKTFDEREFLRDPNSEPARDFLVSSKPDLFLSSGYGRVLREETLRIPTIGAINVHPSLLPRYRGYEAVAWALYEGESEVGITVHSMILPVDSGPILAQKSIPVCKDDQPDAVYQRLCGLIPQVLGQVLEEILRTGAIAGTPQPPSSSFHSKPWREPDQLEVDWTLPAAEVARRARLFHGYCNVRVGPWRIFFGEVEAVVPQPGTIRRRRLRTIDISAGDGRVVRLHLIRPLHAWAKLVLSRLVAAPRLGSAAREESRGIVDDLLTRAVASRSVGRPRSGTVPGPDRSDKRLPRT